MIGLKGIAKRAVFVIDKDGVVRHREVLEDARNEPDYEKVFAALASLAVAAGAVLELRIVAVARSSWTPDLAICS